MNLASPGIEAPRPPENPSNLPIFRPRELRFNFPEGWDIKIQMADGTWSAEKDSRLFTSNTEGGLFALVMDSERRRARRSR